MTAYIDQVPLCYNMMTTFARSLMCAAMKMKYGLGMFG